MLPHRCVTANIDAIDAALVLDYDLDRAASWLPLYHDMGLIGMLMIPMTTGTDLVLAGPQDFLAAPARWAQWISDFKCSITAGPNFSYALSARAMRRGGDLDLSQWRVALNGAEPIEPSSVEDWLAAGAPHGLRVGTAFCAYGMAESTVGITFPEPGKGMIVDAVDRRVLETDGYAAPVDPSAPGSRRLPFLGKAIAGLELRIVEPGTGIPLRDREAGELEVRGSSVTPGYFRNDRATADVFHDEWLRTGDLGYLVDGELIICGRLKDVIIVGGRNVFPEDIERAAAAVEGVRAGNVIAFGAPGRKGRESIVVVAETARRRRGARARRGRDPGDRCRRRLRGDRARAPGIAPEDVVGQAAALAVQDPLPRRHPRTRLAVGLRGATTPRYGRLSGLSGPLAPGRMGEMGAVGLLAGAELRRRWRATIAIALLVGIVGAIVFATVAGARRSSSALPRFNAESRSSDVEINVGQPTARQMADFARTPGVESFARLRGYAFANEVQGLGDLSIAAPLDRRMGRTVDRSRIISGRRADPAAADEITVGASLADRLHLRVGSSLAFASYTQAQIDRVLLRRFAPGTGRADGAPPRRRHRPAAPRPRRARDLGRRHRPDPGVHEAVRRPHRPVQRRPSGQDDRGSGRRAAGLRRGAPDLRPCAGVRNPEPGHRVRRRAQRDRRADVGVVDRCGRHRRGGTRDDRNRPHPGRLERRGRPGDAPRPRPHPQPARHGERAARAPHRRRRGAARRARCLRALSSVPGRGRAPRRSRPGPPPRLGGPRAGVPDPGARRGRDRRSRRRASDAELVLRARAVIRTGGHRPSSSARRARGSVRPQRTDCGWRSNRAGARLGYRFARRSAVPCSVSRG